MTTYLAGGRRWALAVALAVMPIAASAQEPVPQPQTRTELEGLLPEPGFIIKAIDFANKMVGEGNGTKSGFYPETSNMITGAGWISLGPGYRQWLGKDRVLIDGSAAISWRFYTMARARVEVANLASRRVAVGSEVKWQDFTQNTYFGEGPDSLETNRSEYRLRTLDAVGYGTVKPVTWLTIGARGGLLQSPELMEPKGKFTRGNPYTATLFPEQAEFWSAQPDYLHGEAFISADTRDYRSHALRGGIYRASISRYSDRDRGDYSFHRYDVEAAQFATIEPARLTFVAHGWLTASDTKPDHAIPLYLMPSIGGNNTLRSFANYRFHDSHFVVANVEMRVALLDHLDAAVFMDAGNVAPRMGELNFDKRSYGAGFRMHSTKSTFVRLDVAHGSEGWRLTVNTSDPFHLSRRSQRTAPIPFVP